MNKTLQEGIALATELNEALVADKPNCEVIICTPFIHLASVTNIVDKGIIGVGAENCADKASGAYTGEVSAAMVASTGAQYVILGHSERRAYFGETDEIINKKVLKAFEHDLMPIICVGETLEQREQGITEDLVRLQTKIALKDVPAADAEKAVIAYEPVWAIGTGRTATNEQAQEVCGAIRKVLIEIYGAETAEKIRIQYGGSVNAGNATELFGMPDIDGGLVGGASLKADFATIVKA